MSQPDERKIFAKLPAWYRRYFARHGTVKPFEFIPNQPPVCPRLFTTTSNEGHRAWVFYRLHGRLPLRSLEDPREYVKAWDKVNGLKPAPIEWITPTHGNWA